MLRLNVHKVQLYPPNEHIQIQPMLRLNVITKAYDLIGKVHSNTTNVKVKLKIVDDSDEALEAFKYNQC